MMLQYVSLPLFSCQQGSNLIIPLTPEELPRVKYTVSKWLFDEVVGKQ